MREGKVLKWLHWSLLGCCLTGLFYCLPFSLPFLSRDSSSPPFGRREETREYGLVPGRDDDGWVPRVRPAVGPMRRWERAG